MPAEDIPEVDDLDALLDAAAGSAVSDAAGGSLEDMVGLSGSTVAESTDPPEDKPAPTKPAGAGSARGGAVSDPFAAMADYYRNKEKEEEDKRKAEENKRFVVRKMAEEAGLTVVDAPPATNGTTAAAGSPAPAGTVKAIKPDGATADVLEELVDNRNWFLYSSERDNVVTAVGIKPKAEFLANPAAFSAPGAPAVPQPTQSTGRFAGMRARLRGV
jgi:hypothetical protein